MKKRLLTIIVILALAIAVFAGYKAYDHYKNQRFLQEQIRNYDEYVANNPVTTPIPDESWKPILKDAFEKNIENWATYKKTEIPPEYENYQSIDCGDSVKGNPQFDDYTKQSNKNPGDTYTLELPYGITFYYTSNYEHWSNGTFLAFTNSDMRICGIGYPIQIHAYPDKLLWGGLTTGGADEDWGMKVEFVQGLVKDYFSKK